ncbi:hypothetical protein B0A49_08980 [Cryomyces minteri]|uniref:Uncharacterized protein n=1 Tax=Cryomyces minteri TaxID=331657 RepID=A0A4U0WQC5_9PEZI|nr:hypothetical protein B0A49_08980 [Cryomyces minteri]
MTPNPPQPNPSARMPSVPRLPEYSNDIPSISNTGLPEGIDVSHDGDVDSSVPLAKRRILGKRREGDETGKKTDMSAPQLMPATTAAIAAMRPVSPSRSLEPDSRLTSASPGRTSHSIPAPASPTRHFRSPSPRLRSPGPSQIFERNVQESTLSAELSPAIPHHMQTEDQIPAVLEASSLAITDAHLNPDDVEIVQHSAHQPAAVTIAEGAHSSESVPFSSLDDLSAHHEFDDSASNYGALDPTDPRRLSFISFADVVLAENAEGHRDSAHVMSFPSKSPSIHANRSPSPVRSPPATHSPPHSRPTSVRGLEVSSVRAPGSPISSTHSPPIHGELTIETMRQALRKTGSGDLSGARSQPMSAISLEDSAADQHFR